MSATKTRRRKKQIECEYLLDPERYFFSHLWISAWCCDKLPCIFINDEKYKKLCPVYRGNKEARKDGVDLLERALDKACARLRTNLNTGSDSCPLDDGIGKDEAFCDSNAPVFNMANFKCHASGKEDIDNCWKRYFLSVARGAE